MYYVLFSSCCLSDVSDDISEFLNFKVVVDNMLIKACRLI